MIRMLHLIVKYELKIGTVSNTGHSQLGLCIIFLSNSFFHSHDIRQLMIILGKRTFLFF